jgi:hypothetical protein
MRGKVRGAGWRRQKQKENKISKKSEVKRLLSFPISFSLLTQLLRV